MQRMLEITDSALCAAGIFIRPDGRARIRPAAARKARSASRHRPLNTRGDGADAPRLMAARPRSSAAVASAARMTRRHWFDVSARAGRQRLGAMLREPEEATPSPAECQPAGRSQRQRQAARGALRHRSASAHHHAQCRH